MEQTAVKEKPILFSAPMVRAILDGKKTQTRRIVNLRDETLVAIDNSLHVAGRLVAVTETAQEPILHTQTARTELGMWTRENCPYEVGMRLWVPESVWMDKEPVSQLGYKRAFFPDTNEVRHANGYIGQSPFTLSEEVMASGGLQRKVPSIHVPRWASRITLEITDVRVERLQDITEADAIAEGFGALDKRGEKVEGCTKMFARLWDELNKKRGYGWEVNPWVWVVSFKRL